MSANFKILDTICKIGERTKGYQKELNIVSWFDKNPKYDIRGWSEDYSDMTKGICFSRNELKDLIDCLSSYDIDDKKGEFIQ